MLHCDALLSTDPNETLAIHAVQNQAQWSGGPYSETNIRESVFRAAALSLRIGDAEQRHDLASRRSTEQAERSEIAHAIDTQQREIARRVGAEHVGVDVAAVDELERQAGAAERNRAACARESAGGERSIVARGQRTGVLDIGARHHHAVIGCNGARVGQAAKLRL